MTGISAMFSLFSFMPDFLNQSPPGNTLVSIFLRNLLTDKNILPKVSVDAEDIFHIESVMERMLNEFNNYLNICRVKKATEYIKDGYKITAIYGLCGYTDFSTFYRNFKKIMGVTPMEFKKNNQ